MTDLRARAAAVRLLVLDVDGVLTDGGLYYDAQGRVTKRFDVQDGLGIKLAQQVGLDVAVITGLNHGAVESRIRELGIVEYHAGHLDKIPLMQGILDRLGLDWNQAAYLGDDWVDAGVLRRVGIPMAVPNARNVVRELAAWIASSSGGHGAVREAIEFLLDCRGELDSLWQKWSGE
ncbi:3-deoxy-D-manno-octulosonate 8-phosphate phosphatase (KDO 8-P phosphatase) [Paucidesulfovibrio gracilis DSM 16080]|uniref:3-deoxy-D-manno-octulosonate 8-phosphate phosphatase (KDO 8-P phosphatase) n=1 Tax=Paucidesulfovibrio gracilis DSM 16080 TaxID=1121449 RepID=A0A1T4WN56_9BACT|nr:phenylphosphate carboxylase subunit delta [Paucidesulfovibrio gracilis]SKA78328.1 3-deoxy-D-manno-octulosonate 8-phosphate phosphatase (KDO 8-P phosphatase) [Paucidesulfovibrio gracilis DSM 16080]